MTAGYHFRISPQIDVVAFPLVRCEPLTDALPNYLSGSQAGVRGQVPALLFLLPEVGADQNSLGT